MNMTIANLNDRADAERNLAAVKEQFPAHTFEIRPHETRFQIVLTTKRGAGTIGGSELEAIQRAAKGTDSKVEDIAV